MHKIDYAKLCKFAKFTKHHALLKFLTCPLKACKKLEVYRSQGFYNTKIAMAFMFHRTHKLSNTDNHHNQTSVCGSRNDTDSFTWFGFKNSC